MCTHTHNVTLTVSVHTCIISVNFRLPIVDVPKNYSKHFFALGGKLTPFVANMKQNENYKENHNLAPPLPLHQGNFPFRSPSYTTGSKETCLVFFSSPLSCFLSKIKVPLYFHWNANYFYSSLLLLNFFQKIYKLQFLCKLYSLSCYICRRVLSSVGNVCQSLDRLESCFNFFFFEFSILFVIFFLCFF